MRSGSTLHNLLLGSCISRVELVNDHDVDCINKWFIVHLELPGDGRHVQTVEFTVTYDIEWHNLRTLLEENGWLDQVDIVMEFHQGVGYDNNVRTWTTTKFKQPAKEV